MAAKRYELNEAQWVRISPLLPGKAGDAGRRAADNRLFVNGCLWVLRSGAHWCDLPERYGKWKTVHRRFSRWCHAGVWERVFTALTSDRDNQYLMIDSTIIRAHQQAASGKGGQRPGAGVFPRWADHEDPYAGRCPWSPTPLHYHGRAGWRCHPGACLAPRPDQRSQAQNAPRLAAQTLRASRTTNASAIGGSSLSDTCNAGSCPFGISRLSRRSAPPVKHKVGRP